MNKILMAAGLMLLLPLAAQAKEKVAVAADTITASRAFVESKAPAMNLLRETTRRDMLDYLAADTLARVQNALDGESQLLRPVTADFLKVQLTPISTMEFRVLPGKKGQIVAAVYTIGGGTTAADSDVRFYDTEMKELKRDKIFKPALLEDFLNHEGRNHKEKETLLELIPFPTVEYNLSPDSTTLTARLTVESYMGKEDYEKVKPYLQPQISYTWTGKKYELSE